MKPIAVRKDDGVKKLDIGSLSLHYLIDMVNLFVIFNSQVGG
jgi:hypothetical protein